MANIQPQIDFIRTAKLGRDVRESIASGMEAMNTESSTAYSAAITAQDSATNSAQQAAQSATDATNAQQAASNSATSAAGSATNANQSATEAAQSATNAAQSANNAQGYLTTVEQSAQQATQSATNAAQSATNANQSATSAAGSAADANTARQQAMQSATNAQTSATTANNAQTAASVSATNAATSEQNAYYYAQQAQAAANVEIATIAKPGIVMPDGTTITIDQFGRISVAGLNEHIAQSLVSQEGVHGVRIYIDPTTKLIALQQWNTVNQVWVNLFSSLKPDGETIIMDDDGTIHCVITIEVDDELSEESENPVQNKVITAEVNRIDDDIRTNLAKKIPSSSPYVINNADGTYLFQHTSNTNIISDISDKMAIQSKKYKVTGVPNGGSVSTYSMVVFMYPSDGSPYLYEREIGDGCIVDNTDGHLSHIALRIDLFAATPLGNYLFKPMITTDLSATYDDFVPYTGDTGSLNGDVAEINKFNNTKIENIFPDNANGGFYTRTGNICMINLSGLNLSGGQRVDVTVNAKSNYNIEPLVKEDFRPTKTVSAIAFIAESSVINDVGKFLSALIYPTGRIVITNTTNANITAKTLVCNIVYTI